MSNQLALFLGGAIIVLVGFDLIFLEGETLLFLAKRLFSLIEWLAFWR